MDIGKPTYLRAVFRIVLTHSEWTLAERLTPWHQQYHLLTSERTILYDQKLFGQFTSSINNSRRCLILRFFLKNHATIQPIE